MCFSYNLKFISDWIYIDLSFYPICQEKNDSYFTDM